MSQRTTLADGRYHLTEVLGAGSMGAVYRGWDTREGIWRAVKLLSPVMGRSAQIRERFRREARALNQLDHPNIVRIHDFQETAQSGVHQHFLVMDLVPGGNLLEWVRRHGPMPPRLACDATLQICAALVAAHEAGVVHRDIKPQNVLIDRGGVCKVVDFGIARMDSGETLTRTNVKMGSIGFMAPEQQLSARDVDGRADVYAVGVTLLTLLTGTIPLHVAEALEVAAPSLPDAIAITIMRATLPDPDKRYESAERLFRTIARAVPSLPDGDGPALFSEVNPAPLPPDEETSTILMEG